MNTDSILSEIEEIVSTYTNKIIPLCTETPEIKYIIQMAVIEGIELCDRIVKNELKNKIIKMQKF